MDVPQLMSLKNEAFRAYLFYCSVLIIKMMAMVWLTGRHRFAKKIFISPEDTKRLKGAKVSYDDPDIERVRRAHLNDLENIPIFFVASFCYLMTNPSAWLAINLMRAFAVARITHTLVYAVVVVPQPARALAFGVGFLVTAYMACVSLLHFIA